ncbi:MAG TPA: phytoene/squalene synthase family protein [Planctomycetaceae bacterium]|nr:phytoene/squalene synthase family protein [Planctomycetaceae bacterium]
MPVSLDESVAYARALTRRTAGNFYFSFLTLPAAMLRDMCVLYAFMRLSDDLGDDESVPVAERAERIDRWQASLQQALDGGPCAHQVFPALVELVERRQIPPQYLFDVLAGVRTDLDPAGIETFEDLEKYCYLVAGAVGLCCIHVWGCRDERAVPLAIDCGTGFQLTNILRDLGDDAAQGRVYLPREDLERFGYTAADLRAGVRDRRFEDLMRFEVGRAREFYARARGLLAYLEPPGRAAAAAMLGIYGGLLDKIERRGYDVFSRRISLSRGRKLWIALGAMLRHRWRDGPRRVADPPPSAVARVPPAE